MSMSGKELSKLKTIFIGRCHCFQKPSNYKQIFVRKSWKGPKKLALHVKCKNKNVLCLIGAMNFKPLCHGLKCLGWKNTNADAKLHCHLSEIPPMFNAQPVNVWIGKKTHRKKRHLFWAAPKKGLEQRRAPLHVPPRACVRCVLTKGTGYISGASSAAGAQGLLVLFTIVPWPENSQFC